jgi:hypothetical protein
LPLTSRASRSSFGRTKAQRRGRKRPCQASATPGLDESRKRGPGSRCPNACLGTGSRSAPTALASTFLAIAPNSSLRAGLARSAGLLLRRRTGGRRLTAARAGGARGAAAVAWGHPGRPPGCGGRRSALLERESGGGRDGRRSSGADGIDDLAGVDALQVSGGRPEVGMT